MAVCAGTEDIVVAEKRSSRAKDGTSLRNSLDAALEGAEAGLRALRPRTVAVCSGKGGVGKTVTAANLALYCARRGIPVALIDLDPLSDIATLLDYSQPETVLEGADPASSDLEGNTLHLFHNLDLVFPAAKLERGATVRMVELLYRTLADRLAEKYRLIILDLPAGSEYEENLLFLPLAAVVLLVTNPEPTAHVSAGSYLRNALERFPSLAFHLWHNRYSRQAPEGFDPMDVVGNYNRNVAEDLRLPRARVQARDVAFVPEDPSLNLLRGNPSVVLNVHRSLLDTLEHIHDACLQRSTSGLALSAPVLEILRGYLRRHSPDDCSPEEYLEALGSHLRLLLASDLERAGRRGAPPADALELFTPGERQRLQDYLEAVTAEPLRRSVLAAIRVVEHRIDRLEDSERMFAPGVPVAPDRNVDREVSSLLILLSRGVSAPGDGVLRNYGSLLLFYFSLYKLFQSRTVVGLIDSFVPQRTDARGRKVRNRHQQIRALVDPDGEQRRRYLKLIKTLYPVVNKQLSTIIRTFGLGNLLFRNAREEVVREAYVKLLTNFVHETIYSGLSMVVGFDYRVAAAAFQEGAERVLALLADSRPESARAADGEP